MLKSVRLSSVTRLVAFADKYEELTHAKAQLSESALLISDVSKSRALFRVSSSSGL